jgi:hypothetical protein
LEQSRTSQVSELFAQSWSQWNGPGDSEDEALRDFRSIKEAAFNALMDFSGDLAVVTVVDDENDGPTLYSVEGDRLHVVAVVRPGNYEESAEIEDVMHPPGGRLGGPAVPLRRAAHRLAANPPEIDLDIHISGRLRAADDDGFRPARTFGSISNADTVALLIAQELGWKTLP